jgi:hypothetical protein
VPVRRRATESLALTVCAMAAIALSTAAPASWDLSESRRNSFSRADERALAAIRQPISVEVHLAPEDPRRVDLDRRVLSKLRRVRPDLSERYIAATSIGLFEQANAAYGEVWFDVGGRQGMTRAITEDAVLETIYSLADVPATPIGDDPAFRGHPLAVEPRGAAVIFYGLWPAAIVTGALLKNR